MATKKPTPKLPAKLTPVKVNTKKMEENLHLKPATELLAMVKKMRLEMMKEKLHIRAGKERNTRSVFNKRKLLARALSVIREKELELKA